MISYRVILASVAVSVFASVPARAQVAEATFRVAREVDGYACFPPHEGINFCGRLDGKKMHVWALLSETIRSKDTGPVNAFEQLACETFSKGLGKSDRRRVETWKTDLQYGNMRLACYVLLDEPGTAVAQTAPGVVTVPATVASTEKASSAAPKNYKKVAIRDIIATPSKWQNRDVELASVNVYFVEDDDIRLLTSEMATIFVVANATDPKTLAYFKENCETSAEANSGKCRASVKFSYFDHGEDKPNGFRTRTTLTSRDAILTRSGGKRR